MKTKLTFHWLLLFCSLSFTLITANLWAQTKPAAETEAPAKPGPRVFQLSGIVLSRQDNKPISFTRLVVNNRQRLALANEEGFFSLAVVETDTIRFSRVGYKNAKMSVGAFLKSYKGDTTGDYLYTIYYLEEDQITTPTVTIYPYQNAAEVKAAILGMNYDPNNSFALASGNVSPELMAYFTENLPEDEKGKLMVAKQRYNAMYLSGGTAYLPQIDAVTIYNLIKHVKAKSKAEKDENLRSWPDK